jgi:hypothetical protein
MKKLTFCMMTAFVLLSFTPTQLKAAEETKTVSVAAAKTIESTDAAQLARLEEIKAMDMSTLNRSEKKELRNEVKAIKNDQNERSRRYRIGHDEGNHNGRHGGGTVFMIGGGGLLLIILLILLL